MKNKIIYLTPIQAPYQEEFINEINSAIDNQTELLPVFQKPPGKERIHWKRKELISHTLSGNIFKRGLSFLMILQKVNPVKCVFCQYNSFLTIIGVLWCIFKGVNYYIGPIEPLNVNKISLTKYFLKLFFFKIISLRSSGISCMGVTAIKQYRSVYKGRIVDIRYNFDYSNLLNKKIESNNKTLTFLFSGRLVEFRNPLLVIDCFTEIVKRYPSKDLKLIMSGKGELYGECIKLISRGEIDDKVEWINNFKDWYDIHQIYQKSQILLSLQHYSTWGIPIQEAMASGMGIIASRSIEAADALILNGYNGFKVSNKSEALKCMESYVNNYDLVKIHGKRSRDIIQLYNCTESAKLFLDLLQNNTSA